MNLLLTQQTSAFSVMKTLQRICQTQQSWTPPTSFTWNAYWIITASIGTCGSPDDFIHFIHNYFIHSQLFHPFHSQLFHPFTSNSPIPSAIYRSCCPHCKEEEEKKKEENKKTCTVCFEDVVKGMPNTATLKCSHTFHLDCLLKSYREQEHNQSVLCIYILFHPIVFFIH